MPEETTAVSSRHGIEYRKIRYRGRGSQLWLCLGKMFRMFINNSDFLILPVDALLAGLVAFIVKDDLFITMEGTLKGAYGLVFVGLWNGFFNSIRVVCREKDALRREHRSGLHMSSYVTAHVIYQILLCLLETVILLYVFRILKVKYPASSMFTPWFEVDLGITVLLITFAADMLAFLISSIVNTTAAAMTVVPFLLIIQLVFAGGVFSLPGIGKAMEKVMISHYGLTCIGAQGNYNELPLVTGWNALQSLGDYKLGGTISLEKILSGLSAEQAETSPSVQRIRDAQVVRVMTLGEIYDMMKNEPKLQPLREVKVGAFFKVDEILDFIEEVGAVDEFKDVAVGTDLTVGQVLDYITENPSLESIRKEEVEISFTVGQLIDMVGEDTVRNLVVTKSAEASRREDFDGSRENIRRCWIWLGAFALIYAAAALIVLEFIDKGRER